MALATSAAPTYFPAHTIPGRGTFIDGGLWANCPAMVGLVEALAFLDQRPEQVQMLSISTTSYAFRLDRPDNASLRSQHPHCVDVRSGLGFAVVGQRVHRGLASAEAEG